MNLKKVLYKTVDWFEEKMKTDKLRVSLLRLTLKCLLSKENCFLQFSFILDINIEQ